VGLDLRKVLKYVKSLNFEAVSKIYIYLFLACCGSLMLSSTLFHLLNIMNIKYYNFLVKLDYGSICLVYLGSISAFCYYYHNCHPIYAYSMMISLGAACLGIFVFNMTDYLHKVENYALKLKVFAVLTFIMHFVPNIGMLISDWLLIYDGKISYAYPLKVYCF
jgi:predicted membrane channel-forming protein YqfA (hemolysin III family)